MCVDHRPENGRIMTLKPYIIRKCNWSNLIFTDGIAFGNADGRTDGCLNLVLVKIIVD